MFYSILVNLDYAQLLLFRNCYFKNETMLEVQQINKQSFILQHIIILNIIIMITISLFLKLIFISLFINSYSQNCEDHCIECDKIIQICKKFSTNFNLTLDLHRKEVSCLVQNCLNCDSNNKTQCISCVQGYTLDQNKCTENISISGVIRIMIGIVGFTVIYFCLFWCICLRFEGNQINRKIYLKNIESTKVFNQEQMMKDFKYNFDRSECSICLMNETDLILSCNHYFHSECFNDWANIHTWCPICKQQQSNQVKLIFCMNCKNKCVVETRKKIKLLKKMRIAEKCFCFKTKRQD